MLLRSVILVFCIVVAIPCAASITNPANATVNVVPTENNSEYAIIINHTIIPKNTYEQTLQTALDRLKQVQNINLNSAEGQALTAITKKSLIQDYITQHLLQDGAQQLGIIIITKNVQERLSLLKEGYPSEQEFIADISSEGISIPELVQNIRTQLLIEKIIQKLIDNIAVSETELEEFLAKNHEFALDNPKREISQIIVNDKTTAQALLLQLKDGADFAVLARENTIDAESQESEGSLGVIDLDMLPDRARKAVRNLPQNSLSKIIEIDDEYYIFKVGEIFRLNGNRREALRDYLFKEKQDHIFEDWLTKQKEAAQVTVNPALERFYGQPFEDEQFPTPNTIPAIEPKYITDNANARY
ncbi:peptidyl-prolyl cis-trans isomerase [Candidatus Margulisiibacteriota bacterium]